MIKLIVCGFFGLSVISKQENTQLYLVSFVESFEDSFSPSSGLTLKINTKIMSCNLSLQILLDISIKRNHIYRNSSSHHFIMFSHCEKRGLSFLNIMQHILKKCCSLHCRKKHVAKKKDVAREHVNFRRDLNLNFQYFSIDLTNSNIFNSQGQSIFP